jgi:streptogramin lyase
VDSSGNIYVVDTNNSRVEVFNSAGTISRSFTGSGTAAGALSHPTYICLDSGNNIFVSDTGNSRVVKFTNSGQSLQVFSKAIISGGTSVPFVTPMGIAVDSSDDVFISDYANDKGLNYIEKFQPSGAFVDGFGLQNGPTGIFSPVGVTINASNAITVVDTENCAIGRFDDLPQSSTYQGGFYIPASGTRVAGSLQGIATDNNGHLFIADKGTSQVLETDLKGNVLSTIGVPGSSAGDLESPQGVAVDSSGNVYVADGANNVVNIYKPK